MGSERLSTKTHNSCMKTDPTLPEELSPQKERFLIFTSKLDFVKELLKIREMLGITKEGFSKKKASGWRVGYMKKHGKQYEVLILELLKKFQIHWRWKDAIEHFLLTNKSDDSLLPKNLSWALEEVDGSWELRMSIFPGASLAEIRKEWPELKKQLRLSGYPVAAKKSTPTKDQVMIAGRAGYSELKNYQRFNSQPQFESYKKVFELREQGMIYEQITKEMGWEKSDYPKVGTYLVRFKEALEQANLY